jgi:predicted phage baseplate assembly protein
MSLPEPILDDLRFQQDLVDEARRRIVHYCPEWTDYNLSDPGITLIELFAWMTEMIVYRLNRVPDKNYIKFLEMLGIQLQPASSAHTDVTFWLSAPLPLGPEDDTTVTIPRGTEVATRRTEEEREVIFTTDETLRILPPQLTQIRREQDFHKNYLPRLGIEDVYAFDEEEPAVGDVFYLGFDEEEDIAGHILQLTFACEETQAVGVRREDPPLVWECSIGDGRWQEIAPSTRSGEKDTTGGLNNAEGSLVLYLPQALAPDQVYGRRACWVRCRLEPRSPEQGMYAESPRIKDVTAHTLGGTTPATHARIVENELLGRSTGEPGQVFRLEHRPVLALQEGETIAVEGELFGEVGYQPWEPVDDFSQSTRYDRHFVLDTITGEVRFGPSIRQRDGTVRQYGRIPEANREIRFRRYRYGGGTAGNVPAGKLRVLKSSIAYVDRVANLRRAEGGRDQESLEEAKMRARRELQAQERAVTAEDYEGLSRGASRAVARVKCRTPDQVADMAPGMVELLVVPAAFEGIRAGDLSRLQIEERLRETIAEHLDQYRLLTTTLRVKEPRYLGVRVRAEILIGDYAQPEVVQARVDERLRHFITPLALEDGSGLTDEFLDPGWNGWPFGRDLYVSEIYSLIGQVPGVKHVWDVQIGYRPIVPGRKAAADDEPPNEADEGTLAPVEERRLQIPEDTLLCSLDHAIEVVEE